MNAGTDDDEQTEDEDERTEGDDDLDIRARERADEDEQEEEDGGRRRRARHPPGEVEHAADGRGGAPEAPIAKIIARNATNRTTNFMQLPGGEFLFGPGHDINIVATASGGSGTIRFSRNRLSANDFIVENQSGRRRLRGTAGRAALDLRQRRRVRLRRRAARPGEVAQSSESGIGP